MIRRVNRTLPWLIAANIFVATLLLVAGDTKHAMLGLVGAGIFGLTLLISEGPSA